MIEIGNNNSKTDEDYLLELLDMPKKYSFEKIEDLIGIVNWCNTLTPLRINTLLYNLVGKQDLWQLHDKLTSYMVDLFKNWESYRFYAETPYFTNDIDDQIAISLSMSDIQEKEDELNTLYSKLRCYRVFDKRKVLSCKKEIEDIKAILADYQEQLDREIQYVEEKDWNESPFKENEWESSVQILTHTIGTLCSTIEHMNIPREVDFMPLAKKLSPICSSRPFDYNIIDQNILYRILTMDEDIRPVPIVTRYKSWVLAMVYAIANPLDEGESPYIHDEKKAKEWEEKAINYFSLKSITKHRNDLLTRDLSCKSSDKSNRIYDFYYEIRDAIDSIEFNNA